MTATLFTQVTDALVSVLSASLSVDVFDGRPRTLDDKRTGIAVGVDSNLRGDDAAATLRQVWREAGPAPFAHRDESGELVVSVWSQSGDDDFKPHRDAVASILDDVFEALAPVTTLGIPELIDLQILDSANIYQLRTDYGVVVEATFRVAWRGIFS